MLKLPAEMLHIPIAAELRGFGDRFLGVQELVAGQADPGPDAVVHAGEAEGLPVDGLQISFGKMEHFCHPGHAPGKLGAVIDGFAQREQILEAGRGSGQGAFPDGLAQFKKQEGQELVDDPFVFPAREGIFPGEKLKEIMAVFRVRQGKGDSEQGEGDDGGLVGIKAAPVVYILCPAGPVIDGSVRREKDRGACRIFLQPVRRPEKSGRAEKKQKPAVVPFGEIENKILSVCGVIFYIADMVHGYLHAAGRAAGSVGCAGGCALFPGEYTRRGQNSQRGREKRGFFLKMSGCPLKTGLL